MSGVASFQRVDLRMNFYLCLGTGFRTSFCARDSKSIGFKLKKEPPHPRHHPPHPELVQAAPCHLCRETRAREKP